MLSIKLRSAAIGIAFGVFFIFPLFFAEARPKYMTLYNEDAYSLTEYRDNCGICHLTKTGGGERTYFGDAFDDAGSKFTPELRAKYPKFFKAKPDSPGR